MPRDTTTPGARTGVRTHRRGVPLTVASPSTRADSRRYAHRTTQSAGIKSSTGLWAVATCGKAAMTAAARFPRPTASHRPSTRSNATLGSASVLSRPLRPAGGRACRLISLNTNKNTKQKRESKRRKTKRGAKQHPDEEEQEIRAEALDRPPAGFGVEQCRNPRWPSTVRWPSESVPPARNRTASRPWLPSPI